MKFKGFWHIPIPTNVAVQTGLKSQSLWVSTCQLSLSVLMPVEVFQNTSLTFLVSVDVTLHFTFWFSALYCIALLFGENSIGHFCSAPVECSVRERNVIYSITNP